MDLLRGAVMIIMAIDHVRVYSGISPGGPDAGIFFTRWITHYCAPSFAFFAGTSAYLYFVKTASTSVVARFLVTRGLILVLLEMTLIRFFWTFNVNYSYYSMAGVIWMLGWCMVILAAFIRLKPSTIGIIGLVIIFAQQLFSFIPQMFPASAQDSILKVFAFFYPAAPPGTLSGPFGLDRVFGIDILYVIIPWIGVMMAGYWFGQILLLDADKRKKLCLRIGVGAIIAFIVAGITIVLTGPVQERPFIFQLLGQQKYPPSQLFLLMTLGPVIALAPWAEKVGGKFADAVKIIGRVPMFYYILHILLIHLSAFVVNQILYGEISQHWYESAPLVQVPEESRWGLPLLYLVWMVDVVMLYYACRWYAGYKARHPEIQLLKYL